MVEDVIEQLFSLIYVILDGLEHALLLLEFAIQLLLSLVVEVKLANGRLLQLVQFAQSVNLVLRWLRYCLLFLLLLLRGEINIGFGLAFLDGQFLLGDGVLWVLLDEILVVDLVDQLLLISLLLSLFLPLYRHYLFLDVPIHLPYVQIFVIFYDLLLGVHYSDFLLNATELVAQDAIDLISILGVQVVLVRDQLTMDCDPNPILLNHVASFPMPCNLVRPTHL